MDQIFKDVQDQYNHLRETERKSLSLYLSESIERQIKVKVRNGPDAGKGKIYTSGGRIAPYNLRNWKWIEVYGTNSSFNCIISLNMYETDPSSTNVHALYDRIGMYVTYQRGTYFYQTQIYTDIDLPLDDEKKRNIEQLVLEQFKAFSEGTDNK